ncbi:MAG: Lrp/AsnC family transcriptional regulator [Clostridiales bacterium]|jgi:DNA-binding Lrp family transcriptional regulator|nr:Lrp/AsnC family transcriptional regulator [Clostridiales bacterium]
MIEVLKLLEKDSKLTAQQIAAMLGREPAEIEAVIAGLEADGTILKYTALIDWDKTTDDSVTALIEVKIAPQRGEGFERIAERIYQYEEVDSLYLMSGAFDLAVYITAKSIKDVAQFVYARLAPLEGVTATATHFILKKYKEKGCIFNVETEQEERMLFV